MSCEQVWLILLYTLLKMNKTNTTLEKKNQKRPHACTAATLRLLPSCESTALVLLTQNQLQINTHPAKICTRYRETLTTESRCWSSSIHLFSLSISFSCVWLLCFPFPVKYPCLDLILPALSWYTLPHSANQVLWHLHLCPVASQSSPGWAPGPAPVAAVPFFPHSPGKRRKKYHGYHPCFSPRHLCPSPRQDKDSWEPDQSSSPVHSGWFSVSHFQKHLMGIHGLFLTSEFLLLIFNKQLWYSACQQDVLPFSVGTLYFKWHFLLPGV